MDVPQYQILDISIHALLAESDKLAARDISIKFVFLSTLSLRRATEVAGSNQTIISHFYPRSPCGERHFEQKKHPLT